MNNSDLSKHMNAAISMYEDLLGQEAHVGVNQYLLESDIGIVSDFFKIINQFESNKKEYMEIDKQYDNKICDEEIYKKASSDYDLAINQFNLDIQGLLETYGASLEGGQISIPAGYESVLDKQACVYFIAYLYKNYSISDDGKVQRKEMDNTQYTISQNNIVQLAELLEAENFSAAYRLHSKLEIVDPDNVPELLLKGAQLGNIDCRYELARQYLSFLTGNLSHETPPDYEFPAGLDQEKLIEWIKQSRDVGHVYGLSNMQLFIDNVIGALGALFQDQTREEKKVTEQQKLRLIEMAEIVQKISGDEKLNGYIDSILKIQIDSEKTPQEKDSEYKILRKQAQEYLQNEYSKKFSKQESHVDKTLERIYDQNLSHILSELESVSKSITNHLEELQKKYNLKSESVIESERALLIDKKEISFQDTQSMLQNNLAEIDSAMNKIREALEQGPITAQSYRTACFDAAMAVNRLRVEIYYQPHPSEWKQSINNAINSLLQKIRPREHKPYMLFLDQEQKIARQAVKIAKEGLKSLNEKSVREPILPRYLKATKAQVVQEKRQNLEQEKETNKSKNLNKK